MKNKRLLKRKIRLDIQRRTGFNNWCREFEREKTLWEKIKIYFNNLFKGKK